MQAISVASDGTTEALQLAEHETPHAGPGHVLVRIKAVGVNRADLLQRAGHYPPPPGASDILGLECAGEVVELGEGVTDVAVGTTVCALLDSGGYAQYASVPVGQLLPMAPLWSFEQAAALPEAVITAATNLGMTARLSEGETVLIHGGSGGVGTAAIGVARHFGAIPYVSARTAEKITYCLEAGAEAGINYAEEDFVKRIRDLTANEGPNVILDVVGAKYLQQNLKALSDDGRLVIIGLQGGVKAEINLGALLAKRQQVMGTTLRALSLERKALAVEYVRKNVWPAVLSGDITVPLAATFPLAEADEAHALMQSSNHRGKIVLTVD